MSLCLKMNCLVVLSEVGVYFIRNNFIKSFRVLERYDDTKEHGS